MLITCYVSRGNSFRVSVLIPNEDLVLEMNICHYPQHEEKDPRTC